MKKVICFLLLSLCVCFISDSKEVRASEKEGIYIETEGNDNFESAKMKVSSEQVIDPAVQGIVRSSDPREEEFVKNFYVNKYENGYRVTLCAFRLGGTAYFYSDGKVHLLRLYTDYYIYDDSVLEVAGGHPVIENTDGSYSEGIGVFVVVIDDYGIDTFKTWISLTMNSTAISANMELITHQEL